MKTQLLEDIGQSATLSLAPAKIPGNPKAGKTVQHPAPAPAAKAEPAKGRADLGVWRKKPAGEPSVFAPQPPEQQPTPLDLDNVFEEIAALEAQFVPAAQQHEPVIAPVEPLHALPTPPAEPLHRPAIPPSEAAFAPQPTPSPAAPQDPLFDFTPPSPAQQAADPFTPAPTGLTGARQRYFLWAACLLSVAVLVQGGRWLYQERTDTRSLALIAGEAKEKPQADKAANPRATVASGVTPGAGVDASVTAAVPASRPVSNVPPLVMLERDPPAPTGIEEPPRVVADPVADQAAPQPEPVVEQPPARPLPKPPARTARKQSDAPAKRAPERTKREPVLQVARAPAIEAARPAARGTMTATLEACRAHGYNAVQCVKRACEVTQYGFVCRGR